ncbi:hypothetical protein EW146_g8723 [Bondarzewia mesenterica]|uniref:Aquaporin n=1 Tax=Bondarzewia mesenterica TaxID=1095465 RepID=A0A4S4LDS2_9AGAM|nr:hypothetical protein EW146_g8723 [Bondarzewia mesenterica]
MSLPVLKSFVRDSGDAPLAKAVPDNIEIIPGEFADRNEYYKKYPNRWSRIREHLREPAAEMLGTMILVMFGNGAQCQSVLSSNTGVSATPKGDYLASSFGWACGIAMGGWISGGVSGGHINPAVTLSLAVFRGFPWKKVPVYIFAQILGAWIGALIVFANYFHAIFIVEGGRDSLSVPGTAGLFGTYTLNYMPAANSFFDEFLGAFTLLLVIFAVTDKKNGPPPAGLVPLVLFVVLLGVSSAFGMQTGFAINPARDLGPRIMTAMVGYGREVFNYRSQYWLWSPILGSIAGALVASLVYDTLIFVGDESIINRPDAAARKHLAHAAQVEQQSPVAAGSSGHETV